MKEEISAKGIEIEGQYGGYWSNKSKAEASWTIGRSLEIESSIKNISSSYYCIEKYSPFLIIDRNDESIVS